MHKCKLAVIIIKKMLLLFSSNYFPTRMYVLALGIYGLLFWIKIVAKLIIIYIGQ